VKGYLKTGVWASRPNKRNGRTGNITKAAREASDVRLMALMAERPKARVIELAAALGVSHPCVSRRATRLKMAGLVSLGPSGWVVSDLLDGKPYAVTPWLELFPLRVRSQDEINGHVARYG
jgi:hypothetical protein